MFEILNGKLKILQITWIFAKHVVVSDEDQIENMSIGPVKARQMI